MGSIGGLAFVLVNSGGVPPGVGWPIRVVGLLAFLTVLWFGVIRNGGAPVAGPPSSTALRTYGLSVGAMVVAFPLGSLLLRHLGHPELILPWVVIVVGAHFLPFARAFAAPLFRRLGIALIGVGLLGGLLAAVSGRTGASWTGVAAGFVVLTFSGSGERTRRARQAHDSLS